jgi:hypothetical protein
MELSKIRDGFIELSEKVEREDLANKRGFKDDIKTKEIYDEFSWTFSEEAISIVKAAFESAEGDEKRRLRFLLHDITGTHISAELAPLDDALTAKESKSIVKWKDQEIALRMLGLVLRDLQTQDERLSLYEAATDLRKEFSAESKKILEKKEEISKRLGYKGYLDLQSQLKNVNYPELVEIAKQLLKKTEVEYQHYYKKLKEKKKLEKVFSFEVGFLLNDDSKAKFPATKLMPLLRNVMTEMGINIDDQKNIIWDVEQREKKVPRAFCYPVLVPDEIYVIVNPKDGKDFFVTLFHEAGHAEHFAHANKDLAWEFKLGGLNSTAETWSYLFDHLFTNREFLKQHTSLSQEETEELLENLWFKELFFIRRYAAKCIY